MAKRPVLSTISNILTSLPFINSNYDAVNTAFDNTVSRDGSTPNNMLADLDMDGNNINNVAALKADNIVLNGTVLSPSGNLTVAGNAVDVAIADADGYYTGVTVETALQEIGPLNAVTASATELNYITGLTSGVQTQLDALAPIDSPEFTGVPTVPTAVLGTDTLQAASTSFVQNTLSEVGTWSPQIDDGTGTRYDNPISDGYYVKQGPLVTIWFKVGANTGTTTGPTGGLFIAGLPFDHSSALVAEVLPTAVCTGDSFNNTPFPTYLSVEYGNSASVKAAIGPYLEMFTSVDHGVSAGFAQSTEFPSLGSAWSIEGCYQYLTDE